MTGLAPGRAAPPLTHALIDRIADRTGEPSWARAFRHRALDAMARRPLPAWIDALGSLDLAAGDYAPGDCTVPLPEIPDALREAGVVVLDLATAMRRHEQIVREHFGTVVPHGDNKLAALNGAAWSAGWLVWVPEGVVSREPLPVPRGLAASAAGRVERTLVVVERGSDVTLLEESGSAGAEGGPLRACVTEVVVADDACCRFHAVRRDDPGAIDLATKRAVVGARGCARWSEATIGGLLTMRYPSAFLRGEGATAEVVSVAVAGSGEHHDVGGRLVVDGAGCTGRVFSLAIAAGDGQATFRGAVRVAAGAGDSVCTMRGEALRTSPKAETAFFPFVELDDPRARVEHGMTSLLLDEEAMAEAAARGATREEAAREIVLRFVARADDDLLPAQRDALGAALATLPLP